MDRRDDDGSGAGPSWSPPRSERPHRPPPAPAQPYGPPPHQRSPHPAAQSPPPRQPSPVRPPPFAPRPEPSAAPRTGWRQFVDRFRPGAAAAGADARSEHRERRIAQPVRSDYRIALLSLKGGVGKTTVTVGLGSVFASMRRDNVVALDANPDFGTLGERVPRQTMSTVRDLLAAQTAIRSYADIREHTSQSTSRLEVVAGERDPAASEAFTEQDYRAVIDILRRHYSLILTDCGTGIMHSAMDGVLSLAHALVLVSSPAVDGAKSAAATLDWLGLHGYAHLVERTVVVISAHRPGVASVDMTELRKHFLARCRAVVVIPFDEHLAEGSVVDLGRLRPRTRDAFVELAAMMADDFPDAAGRHASEDAVPRGW